MNIDEDEIRPLSETPPLRTEDISREAQIRRSDDINQEPQIENLVFECFRTERELIQLIVERGFNVNREVTSNGFALLHLAVRFRDAELALYLLKNGAAVNMIAKEGITPLQLSMLNCDYDTFELLLKYHADPQLIFSTGEYPIHRACRIPSSDFLYKLLSRGANPLQRDDVGNLPLHIACEGARDEHIELLVAPTKNVNCLGENNRTPLHFLANNNKWDIIKYLIGLGANFEQKDGDGHSPLDIIIQNDFKDMLAAVAEHYTKELASNLKSICDLFCSSVFDNFAKILSSVDDKKVYVHEALFTSENDIIINRTTIDDFEMAHFLTSLHKYEVVSKSLSQDDYRQAICSSFVRDILYKENEQIIIYMISFDRIWPLLETMITDNIEKLYLWSVQKNHSMGALEIVTEKFIKGDEFKIDDFLKWTASLVNVNSEKCAKYKSIRFKNPLRSLLTWAIITNKSRVVFCLLRLNHIDVIPFALYSYSLFNDLAKLKRLSWYVKESYNNSADFCEQIAIDAMNLVGRYDPSSQKAICSQYVLTPLENFGDMRCLDLAAVGGSFNFLQLKACQHSLNVSWYRDLYYLHPLVREVMVFGALIPYNVFVPMYVKRLKDRKITDDQIRPEHSDDVIVQRTMTSNIFSSETKDGTKRRRNAPVAAAFDTNITINDIKEDSDHENETMEIKKADVEILVPRLQEGHRVVANEESHTALDKYLEFLDIPAVKFRLHAFSLCIFLALLSYVVMLKLHYHLTWIECGCYFYMIGFFIEECYELICHIRCSSVLSYFESTGNIVDLTGLTFGLVGIVGRCFRLHEAYNPEDSANPPYVRHDDVLFYMVRVALCISLLCYFVKLISIGSISQKIGPKVKMMAEMIWRDLIPFMFILSVFMISFGIVFQALLYPNGFANDSPVAWKATVVLQSMVKLTFYGMMGDYQLDRIEGEECRGNCPHPIGAIIVPMIFMLCYVIITNILLLNLVIALFSKTIDNVDNKAQVMWEFERYSVEQEYVKRSAVPPPLDVLQMAVKGVQMILNRYVFRRNGKEHRECGLKTADFVYFLVYQAFALRRKRLTLGESKCVAAQDDDTHERDSNVVNSKDKNADESDSEMRQLKQVMAEFQEKLEDSVDKMRKLV